MRRLSVRGGVFFCSLWLLFYVAEQIYVYSIVPSYGYYGFKLRETYDDWIVLSIIFFLLNSALLTFLHLKERPSTWIVVLLFCLSYIPCVIHFEHQSYSIKFYLQIHLYWLLVLLVMTSLDLSPSRKYHESSALCDLRMGRLGEAIVYALATYVVLVKLNYNGLYIHTDLATVYDIRSSAANADLGFAANYLISWSSLTFTIRGVMAAAEGRYGVLIFMFVLQVLIFSIAGHKFYLFALPAALVAYTVYRGGLLTFVPIALSSVLLFSFALAAVADQSFGTFSLAFRNMFLPALITGRFYDFFDQNSPDYLAQSVLRRFGFESTYEMPIPYLIDLVYANGDASANTGLSADAISNFGLYGIMIYPILFSVVLKSVDFATHGTPLRYHMGIVVFFMIAFLNTALFTALLTGGVIFYLIFFPIMVKRQYRTLLVKR